MHCSSCFSVVGQRQHWERMPVQMILQIKHARESGSGGEIFVPAAVTALRLNQILGAFVYATAGGIATRDQPQNRPGRLRRRAVGWNERLMIVAGAAFTPSAVGVLDGPQPFARA